MSSVWILSAAILLGNASFAAAQSSPPPAQPPPDTQVEEARPHPAEPDFRIVSLPTTLTQPKGKWGFAITHRFNGNLRRGDFVDQLETLFGIDDGATIGIDLRYAVTNRLQAIFLRTNIDRTIQFAAKYDAVRQGSFPVSLSPIVSVDGGDNFRERYQPAVAVAMARALGERIVLHAVPTWAGNTDSAERHTAFIGLGGRLEIRPRTFVVFEVSPRVAGYRPGVTMYGVAIERRVGGHVFQLNFTNTPAATLPQIARGGFVENLNLGFNITRKFY